MSTPRRPASRLVNLLGTRPARNAVISGAATLWIAGTWATACTAPKSDGEVFRPTTSAGGTEGSGDGGPGGPGATGSGGRGGGQVFGGDDITDRGSGGVSADAACAATTQMAETIVTTVEVAVEVPVEEIIEVPVEVTVTQAEPVALFIMIDRSGSMITGFPAPASPESWNNATTAITAFVNDPLSNGIDVGLGTFPYGQNNTADCGGADCGQAVVPIGALPGNAPAMVTGMQNNAPSSPVALTPTECGINGMISHCAAFMAQSTTGEKCVAILVTDGTPTQCDTAQANLVTLVGNGLASGVMTYTLGLPGADMNFLNQLAQAGGTTAALDVSQGPQAFIDSLNSIRNAVTTIETHTETRIETRTETQTAPVDCEWGIPAPPEGETFDKELVNVQFSAGSGAAQRLGYLESPADCATAGGGWYYDDPANPVKVLVCDQTCGVITGATDARIDVLLGCATEPAIVK